MHRLFETSASSCFVHSSTSIDSSISSPLPQSLPHPLPSSCSKSSSVSSPIFSISPTDFRFHLAKQATINGFFAWNPCFLSKCTKMPTLSEELRRMIFLRPPWILFVVSNAVGYGKRNLRWYAQICFCFLSAPSCPPVTGTEKIATEHLRRWEALRVLIF